MKAPLISTSILIFLLSTCYNLNSQNYQAMAVEGATWIMSGYGDYHYKGWSFRIEGDTIVNSILYKKIYHYHLEVEDAFQNNDKTFKVISKEYAGLMRDDFENRKVYTYDLQPLDHIYVACDSLQQLTGEETQLFDFNLTVGDTLPDCMLDISWNGELENKIITRDTFMFRFDKHRRVLSNQYGLNSLVDLIEGIGYASGLFYPASLWVNAGKGIGLYSFCIGSNWDCGLTTSTQDNIIDSSVHIFPNPSYDIFKIESPSHIQKINVYNNQGQQIHTTTNSHTIDLSHHPSGYYYIEVLHKNSPLHRAKIIKI